MMAFRIEGLPATGCWQPATCLLPCRSYRFIWVWPSGCLTLKQTFLFMKSWLLSCAALAAASTLNAQLSFLPQAGFEQSRTGLNYGNGLSACSGNAAFKAALKTDYRFKGGHSPFINIATTPAPVRFAFNNLGALESGSPSATNGLRLRLEAGYQWSSLPIRLGKKGTASPTPAPVAEPVAEIQQRSRCGLVSYRSSCGSRKKLAKPSFANNPLSMRLQPALAFAYVPSNTESLTQTANGFEYAAGTWKTALVPSMGFEFAKGRQRLFTLTMFYTQPLNQPQEAVAVSSGFKAVNIPLQSRTPTWGITAGVPFSFAKSSHPKVKKEKKVCERNYYRRCIRVQ